MKDVGASVRRHWPVALGILLAIPFIVAVYLINRDTRRPPARYSTSADLLIPTSDSDNAANVPPVLMRGQTELALSSATKTVALDAAKADAATRLDARFDAALSENRDTMTLSVSASRPETAASLLEQYVNAYQNGRRQSVVDAAIELKNVEAGTIRILTRKLDNLEGKLNALGVPLPDRLPDGSIIPVDPQLDTSAVLMLYERNSVLNEITRRQVDYAFQSTRASIPGDYSTVVQHHSAARITPPPPSPLVPLLEIIGGGLLAVGAIPVLMDRFGRTITDTRGAANLLRSRVLVSIPAVPRRLHHSYAAKGSLWDESFRSLAATSISTDSLPPALMVSTPVGSIQDTVAANYAVALARLGVTVALIATMPRQRWMATSRGLEPSEIRELEEPGPIDDEHDDEDDADFESLPTATTAEMVELPVFAGDTLADLLEEAQSGRLNGNLRQRMQTIGVPNLYVVPPPSDDSGLALDGLPPFLDALSRNGIDVAVLAAPAFLEDSDATIFAWSTRSILWAVEIGHVDNSNAQLAADRVEIAGVVPFGIAVVNRHL